MIFLNDEPFEFSGTVNDLILYKNLKPEAVVILINNEICRKNSWNSRLLSENDRVEIVSFVGGG